MDFGTRSTGEPREVRPCDPVPVEARPGAGSHGQSLGLYQSLDVGLDPFQRIRVKGRAQLGIELP